MNKKKLTAGLILYECRSIIGNPFTLFFGLAFPILMSMIITMSMKPSAPDDATFRMVSTSVFINMLFVIPLSVILIGYAANYSQDLEKGIPLRMNLFGFSQRALLGAKIIAQLLAMTAALVFYVTFSLFALDLMAPTVRSVLVLFLCLYLLAAIFFLVAHSIATLLKKFGPTYCVTMILYFLIMICCGMMGFPIDNYPPALQAIARTIPVSYFCDGYLEYWKGNSYNFMPLIQSFLFIGAVSAILLFAALHREKRTVGSK